MKKKIKKLTLYSTTLLMILTGVKIKSSKDKSKEFTNKVLTYTNDFDSDNFKIAAHRGFSSLEVENTKDAITLADNTKYIDYIEVDVRLTKDKKLVLSHDNELIIGYQQKIKISNESYESLKDYTYYNLSYSIPTTIKNLFNSNNGDILIQRSKDLETKKYQLPSLKEGIDSCNNKKLILDLKFKNNTNNFINELDEELKDIDTNNIIFQSDDLLSLLVLKEKHPNYSYQAIIKNKSDLEYIDLFDKICLKKTLVTNKLIDKLVKEEKEIAIWTLNNPDEVESIVDSLDNNYQDIIYITDYPDVVATCLNEKQKIKEKTNH